MTELRNRKRVAIIGDGACDETVAAQAREIGRRLAEMGVIIVCGGLGGVMRAACQGAKQAGGMCIGILPGEDRASANEYVDIPIATSLSHMRNYLVVLNADAVLAVQGGKGTLSELALAIKSGKEVVALGRLNTVDGVLPAKNVDQALDLIGQCLDRI